MTSKPRLVGLGAGGQSKVVVDALLLQGSYDVVGLLDADPAKKGARVLGVPVLGDDDLLEPLRGEGVELYFVSVGQYRVKDLRRRLADRADRAGLLAVTIVHPSAIVSPGAQVLEGCIIMPGAIVNAGARLGRHVIVNSGAVVEHDCKLADFVHVAPGARLGGGVAVETGSHIGLGAVLRETSVVGAGAVVGAGTLVVKDVPGYAVVAGVPAEPMDE